MSTPSTESDLAPAADPSTDGAGPADQVKADAGVVAASIAKGAATGGAAGAALGALKGAVRTGTGRKALLAAVAAPIVALFVLIAIGSGGAATSVSAFTSNRDLIANEAVAASFKDNPDGLRSVKNAATMTGVRWEVLAAIQQTAKSRPGTGTGPFGIDMAKAEGIIEADAGDFDKSALYLGHKLAAASQGTLDALPSRSLDTGYMDSRGDQDQTVLKPSELAGQKHARDQLKKFYVAAIATLPLSGNPEAADDIYTRASNWAIGSVDQCLDSSVSVGAPSGADLTAKKKEYAQAIIDRVAAKGMPEKAAVIALATALQESGLQMYWNSSVPGSKELSFGGPEGGFDLGPGRKSYSVGLFQQQVNGSEFSWGTVTDAMNPGKSADMFLDRLMTIPGWQDLDVTVAAQKVQISAFPDAYADDEVAARKLVAELKPASGSYGTTVSPSSGPAAPASPAESTCRSGGIGTGTAGKGDDYPFKNPVGVFTTEADPWSLYKRQCVSFVAWRINVQMGWKPGQEYPFTPAKLGVGLFGNANQWKDTVGSKYKMDQTPKVGAIAWWDSYWVSPSNVTGDAGHVAIVSAVHPDGSIEIEEYNFNPLAYSARKIPVEDVTAFIHVADIDK